MRNEEISNFVKRIYCPVAKEMNRMQLLAVLRENTYREISAADSGKTFCNCLVIKTRGKGERETFDGFMVTRIDVGEISKQGKTVSIAVRENGIFAPIRVALKNPKYSLLDD